MSSISILDLLSLQTTLRKICYLAKYLQTGCAAARQGVIAVSVVLNLIDHNRIHLQSPQTGDDIFFFLTRHSDDVIAAHARVVKEQGHNGKLNVSIKDCCKYQ